MQKIKVYNSEKNIYNDFKELIISKLKEKNNDFIVILPNGNLIDRLRKDIVNEFKVTFDLKLFTFDDLINYKNTSFSEVENFDYYSKLLMNYSINNCIENDLIENNDFYNSTGFLPLASKMVNYIKSSLISPDKFLREVKDNSSLFSIGKIYEEYSKNLCKYKFEDRYDKYFNFLDSKFSFDIESEVNGIFVFGFLDFRKIEYEILKTLIDLEIDIQLFYYNSLDKNIDIYKETNGKLSKMGFEIEDKASILEKSNCSFILVECEDKYLEVKRLAIEVKRDLLKNSRKKFGIIVNDEEYIDIIKERFTYENIPLNTNSKVYLNKTILGKWILNLLDMDVDLDKFIIRNLKNPLIFSEPIIDIELEELILSLNIKNKEDIFNSNLLKNHSKYNEYYEVLSKFFDIISITNDKEKLLIFIKESLKEYILNEDENIVFYEKFYTFVDNLEFRLTEVFNSLKDEEFIKYMIDIVNDFSINENSIIDYGISLIEFNNSKLLEFDNVYILGMSEDNYPKKEVGDFYFNNKSILNLRKIGLDILNSKLKNSKDELNFNNMVNTNYEKVYLSYEVEGKAIVSDYVLNISDVIIKEKEIYRFKNFINPNINEIINIKDKDLYISQKKDISSFLVEDIEIKEVITKKRLYDRFSATSLETYFLCPIKYYFKYIIELSDQLVKSKLEELALIGTACHETLQKLYKYYYDDIKNNVENNDIIFRILKTQFKELDFNIDDFKGSNILSRYTYLINKLVETDIKYINDSGNNLIPYKFEEKFEFKKELTINGKLENIVISGRIDRIDRDENNNFYLVDYKLGKNSFNTLKDFEKKKTLQFPIYSLIKNVNGCRYITIKDYKIHEFYKLSKDFVGKEYLDNEGLGNLNYDTIVILEDIISKIRQEDYFKGTDDLKNCTFCEYKDICDYRSK